MTRKRPADLNRLAFSIVADATNEEPGSGKDPAAVALGRKGGLKGGPARAAALTPQRRSEIAGKASAARWHPGGTGTIAETVLVTMLLYPGAGTVAEICEGLERDGFDLARPQVQNALSRSARREPPFVESVSPGVWRLTDHGNVFLDQLLEDEP